MYFSKGPKKIFEIQDIYERSEYMDVKNLALCYNELIILSARAQLLKILKSHRVY